MKIRDIDDFDMSDLGISQDFINKINHLKEFHYIDEYVDGDVEWRPSFK